MYNMQFFLGKVSFMYVLFNVSVIFFCVVIILCIIILLYNYVKGTTMNTHLHYCRKYFS